MTEHRDPVRWTDDRELDPALGALLRDNAPPDLTEAEQAEIRARLVGRVEDDARTASRGRSSWAAMALLAAALLLVLWQWPRSVTPIGTPPIAPEPDDAGPPARPAEVDAGPPDADTDEPEPVAEELPWLNVSGNGCGLEIAVSLAELDDAFASVAVVMAEDDDAPVSCDDALVELDRAVFDAAHGHGELWLPLTVLPPRTRCGAAYEVAVCARDARGHRRLGVSRVAETDSREPYDAGGPRIATPSGPASPHEIGARAALVSFANVPPALRPWATPYTTTPVLVESRVRRVEPRRAGAVELRFLDGRVAVLPDDARVWLPMAHAYRVATELVATDEVLGQDADRRVIAEVLERPEIEDAPRLDVSWPDTLFIDDVLVHDMGPGSGSLPPADVTSARTIPEPVYVAPRPAWDCTLRLDLIATEIPSGTESIAIAYVEHRGAAHQRMPIDCATAHIGADVPVAVLSALPPDAAQFGLPGEPGRRLMVELSGWDAENGDWHPRDPTTEPLPERSIECDSEYAAIACLRTADGTLHALPTAEGRYVGSGPACFAAGTLVVTPDGEVPIERLGRGAFVETLDASGALVRAPVTALIPRGMRPVLALVLSSGATLEVTAEHPLYDPRLGRFRVADEIAAGDALLDHDGHEVEVLERIDGGTLRPVFDLSVAAPHTYFAGGVLAHNY